MTRPARIAVVYYSATGNVHRLAHALAQGQEAKETEMRVRHVEELASELLISQNQSWGRHRSEVEDEPVATLEDLEWADGVAFGTPTRFGNVAAQLKQFRIDCLARANTRSSGRLRHYQRAIIGLIIPSRSYSDDDQTVIGVYVVFIRARSGAGQSFSFRSNPPEAPAHRGKANVLPQSGLKYLGGRQALNER